MTPLFWVALSFAAGILLSHYATSALWVWSILSGAGLILLLLLQRIPQQPRWLKTIQESLRVGAPLLFLCLALGGLRYTLELPHWTENDLAWYNDRGSYTLVAVVDETPDRREDVTYLHLAARELYDPATMSYHRIDGKALLRLSAGASWQLGDLLRFTASPQTPSSSADFSYQAYLERQNIYTVIYYPASIQKVAAGQVNSFAMGMEWLRQRASQTIFASFMQPEAGLLQGILLGNDNALPPATTQAYQDTGTAHIIAISGFNMVILAAVLMALFTRVLNRYWAAILSSLALITYAVFVGGSPSVIRAAIMAIAAFFGRLIGRKNGGLNALGLAGGAILLINPLLLWDASFQLSFAATLGLVLFATPMQEKLENGLEKHFSEKTARQFSGPISDYFLLTLAAQVTTLPVIALQFKQLSLTSLIANPLVLPVQPAILVAGGAATLAGIFVPVAGKVLGTLVWPLLAYSNRIVEWLDQIPAGAVTLTGSFAVALSLTLIAAILLFAFRASLKKVFKKIPFTYSLLCLACLCTLVWATLLRGADGSLHFSLIRAEGNTALFLQSPAGQTLLIDPAGSPDTLAGQLSASLAPWNFHLDAALLTRRISIPALSDLNERLPVRQAILSPAAYRVTDGQKPLALPKGMQVQKLTEGEAIRLDGEVLIQPLGDDDTNTALLLSYGQTRIFIPNGVDPSSFTASRPELHSLTALVLTDTDVANLPVGMWNNYGAQVILWNSTSIAPDPHWLGLDTADGITLTSDGQRYGLAHTSIQ